MSRPGRSQHSPTGPWVDVALPLLAAAAILAAPFVSVFPLSATVWVRLVLRPLLGASLSAARGSGGAFDVLRVLAPWLGAVVLGWTILRAASARHTDTGERPLSPGGLDIAAIVTLGACAVSISAAEAFRIVSSATAWPYVHAALSALFGGVFVARALAASASSMRGQRTAAVAAGICIATYVLLPLGLLLLLAWCFGVAVSVSLRRTAGA